MDMSGKEYKWWYSIDMYCLLKFKQIVINFYEDINNILNQQLCYDKLNYTHYIINIIKNEHSTKVVYLRKDIYKEYDDFICEKDLIGITIDNVADLI